MNINKYASPAAFDIRYLAFASVILAILGGAFYWWVPTGLVLSIAGLILGFVGWTYAPTHSSNSRMLLVGTLLSLAALIVDAVIVYLNLEIITFHAFQ